MNSPSGGLRNGMLRKRYKWANEPNMKLTKPDVFVFLFWAVLGALVSSDENPKLIVNLWHGFILGMIFLGFFKFFKMGIFK